MFIALAAADEGIGGLAWTRSPELETVLELPTRRRSAPEPIGG